MFKAGSIYKSATVTPSDIISDNNTSIAFSSIAKDDHFDTLSDSDPEDDVAGDINVDVKGTRGKRRTSIQLELTTSRIKVEKECSKKEGTPDERSNIPRIRKSQNGSGRNQIFDATPLREQETFISIF